MKQVAIYGKGGIGKSTVSANISFQLTKNGLKVAQIGCDPKHDSTRLLLGGKGQTTVLDHINSGSTDVGDTVSIGKNGTICIETGGPEPGVGCAGRGILTAFNFLENNNIIDHDTDVILYDVLGDVVCGGFAVPLRRKYADAVFIVTSGEFMSLYAANNVLKGVRNFDNDRARVAGLILNMRGNEGEYEYVKNFADAVGLPIVARIPRSQKFSIAESKGVTASEEFPDSEEYAAIGNIVGIIRDLLDGKAELHPACPLDDDALDRVAKGLPVVRDDTALHRPRELAVSERNVLRGCGSAVACGMCTGIIDADIIIHGPKSCHYFFTTGYDGMLVFENKAALQGGVSQRIFGTDLDDHSSIFGGNVKLRKLIESRLEKGVRNIFVITTCVPGIIGDDVEGLCRSIQTENPGTLITPVDVDGILNGGALQARELVLRRLCTLVDRDVVPDPKAVNLIGYTDTSDKTMMAADDTDRLLEGLGLTINCRLFNDHPLAELQMFKKGSIDLMAGFSVPNRHVCQTLEKTLGIPWYREHLPVGISQTLRWIDGFGSSMGVPEDVRDGLKRSFGEDFEEFKAKYSGAMKGLTAVIYCPTAMDIDWLFDVLDVLGVAVKKIYSPTNSRWSQADEVCFADRGITMEGDIDFDDLCERLDRDKPDMVLGSNPMLTQLKLPHYNFNRPRIGVRPSIQCAMRIIRMMEVSRI